MRQYAYCPLRNNTGEPTAPLLFFKENDYEKKEESSSILPKELIDIPEWGKKGWNVWALFKSINPMHAA
jgi:hypothetical protein